MERLTHQRSNGIKTGYWSPNKKDELVERLAAYEDTGLSPEGIERLNEFEDSNGEKLLKEIAKHRWISVEERLPEKYTSVLVTAIGERDAEALVYEGALGTEWTLYGVSNPDYYRVLAWMQLPEAYRE